MTAWLLNNQMHKSSMYGTSQSSLHSIQSPCITNSHSPSKLYSSHPHQPLTLITQTAIILIRTFSTNPALLWTASPIVPYSLYDLCTQTSHLDRHSFEVHIFSSGPCKWMSNKTSCTHNCSDLHWLGIKTRTFPADRVPLQIEIQRKTRY